MFGRGLEKLMLGFAALALVGSSAFAAELPSNEEIAALFQTSRTNLEAKERVWPLITETCNNASNACPDEIRRVQHCIATNILNMSVATNADLEVNFDPICSMVRGLSCMKSLENDCEIIDGVSDFIGKFQTVPTDSYSAEVWSVGTNAEIRAFRTRWRNLLGYNSRIIPFRDQLVTEFSPLYLTYEASLPESDRALVLSNVIRRAHLTSEELLRLRAGRDDDLYDELKRQATEAGSMNGHSDSSER